MIENGHFRELQSIIDMLPMTNGSIEGQSQQTQNCVTVSSLQRKKRQTLVFSATLALSADFRKKLKHGALKSKQSTTDGLNSIETLSERAGMKANVAIVDLTNALVLAKKLEESFIEYVFFQLVIINSHLQYANSCFHFNLSYCWICIILVIICSFAFKILSTLVLT